jgi:hypothetical protein
VTTTATYTSGVGRFQSALIEDEQAPGEAVRADHAVLLVNREQSSRCGSMDDTSSTAANRAPGSNTGVPEQLRPVYRELKCCVWCTETVQRSAMQVPMPLAPSTASDHTPPTQMPQYRNSGERADALGVAKQCDVARVVHDPMQPV